MDTQAKPMVRIEGLRKSFGSLEVLRDINLNVMPGQVVTIIGPSGSGKSTLLRCINLLESPDAGHVWFHGANLAADHVNVNALREKIGMVFQGFNLFNNKNVLDNCTLAPVLLKKMTRDEAEHVAMEHLESVGMAAFAHAAVNTLSGGQKQRVAIAGVIAMRPRCIVLDEPTAMLDPHGREEVISTIERLNREMGITVVLITHHMTEAIRAQRVIVMDAGRILADGTPKEVFPQVELLESVGLTVPATTKVLYALNQVGFDLPLDALSTEECAQVLLAAIGAKT